MRSVRLFLFLLCALSIGSIGCGNGTKLNTLNLSTNLPAPKFLYATSCGSNPGVYGYSVNPVTGALTALSGSPFTDVNFKCGEFPAVDPSQHYLFVPEDRTNLLYVFVIGSDGS